MKLVKAHIVNFQSVKDLTILIDRFTVVVGPSHKGKTTIMKALSAPFQNPSGNKFIRHGASSAKVELFFDTGLVIKWEKTPKAGASYEVRYPDKLPIIYDKVGRDSPPPEVMEIVHPWSVSGGPSRYVQLQAQRDLEFVFGETSDAQTQRMLDDIEGRIYRQALTSCQTSVRSLNRQMSDLSRQEDRYKKRLELMQTVDELLATVDTQKTLLRLLLSSLLGYTTNLSLDLARVKLSIKVLILYKYLSLDYKSLKAISERISLELSLLKIHHEFNEIKAQLASIAIQHREITRSLFSEGICPLCGAKAKKGILE